MSAGAWPHLNNAEALDAGASGTAGCMFERELAGKLAATGACMPNSHGQSWIGVSHDLALQIADQRIIDIWWNSPKAFGDVTLLNLLLQRQRGYPDCSTILASSDSFANSVAEGAQTW